MCPIEPAVEEEGKSVFVGSTASPCDCNEVLGIIRNGSASSAIACGGLLLLTADVSMVMVGLRLKKMISKAV